MTVDRIVTMAHRLIEPRLKLARCVIDATAGNGNDTLFLAGSSPADAVIWAFDIQRQALQNVRELLCRHGLEHKVRLVNECHSKVALHIRQPIDVAMFNLGYLPGGEHGLITQAQTTTAAIRQTVALLSKAGIISVVVYPGHPGGSEEHETVRDYIRHLPGKQYKVACWSMVNQREDAPLLYIIEYLGGGAGESNPTGTNQGNN
jgi:hypothetical protein